LQLVAVETRKEVSEPKFDEQHHRQASGKISCVERKQTREITFCIELEEASVESKTEKLCSAMNSRKLKKIVKVPSVSPT
jgi:hypothetical protein